jgi:RND family efflux transporter MFP subunit
MSKRSERRLKWGLSVAVIVASIAIAIVLVATKEEPPRADKPMEGTLVEVVRVESSRHSVELHAKGTVVPAMEILLQPEVSGRVVWQSEELVPGGRFDEDEPILTIDPRDYQLAVESFRSQVRQARLDYTLEKRRGEVAKREWNSFGETDATDEQRALAQREPQLEATKLQLKAAQSALKKAELDLKRATLRAPFNAMVVSESVDVGQLVNPQMTVARLVGTDAYHVQVSVPVAALRTIRARRGDTPGSPTMVTQRVGQGVIERRGEVIRQLPDLDPGGAMARILVRIADPLGADDKDLPLLLGAFVDVAAEAQPIENAIRVPRLALRNGNQAYVMNDEGLLEVRDVEIAWSEPDSVLVTAGLRAGERLVTSRIAIPVPNMLLRTADSTPELDPLEEGPSEPAARATP